MRWVLRESQIWLAIWPDTDVFFPGSVHLDVGGDAVKPPDSFWTEYYPRTKFQPLKLLYVFTRYYSVIALMWVHSQKSQFSRSQDISIVYWTQEASHVNNGLWLKRYLRYCWKRQWKSFSSYAVSSSIMTIPFQCWKWIMSSIRDAHSQQTPHVSHNASLRRTANHHGS